MRRYLTWPVLLPILFLPVYGSGYIAGGLGLEHARPFAMTFWRFAIAGLVVLGIVLARRTPWPRSWARWRTIALVGFLLQVVQFGGNYTAMGLGMPAALTALIVGSSSLMIAIGAVPFLRERLTPLRLAGILVGFAGVAIALAEHIGAPSGIAGIAAALSGAVGYAAGSLIQRKMLNGTDLWLSLAIQFLVAAPVTAILASATGGIGVPLTTQALLPIAWLALVNSVGGMWLLGQMLRHHSAATLSAWSNLIPPLTGVLAVPFLGQPMSAELLLGLAVALAGTTMVVLRPGRAAAGSTADPTSAARLPGTDGLGDGSVRADDRQQLMPHEIVVDHGRHAAA